MQVISLFSGIGGFDLAASWLGWKTILLCDNKKFSQKILSLNFPNIPLFGNIEDLNIDIIKKQTEYDETKSTIVVGGFPCQPFSLAGKRKGSRDNRFIWNEMHRIIKEVKADWILAENVNALISQEHGLVFEKICIDLENEGYEIQSLLIPVTAVDGCHKRERVFIVGKRTTSKRRNIQNTINNTNSSRLQNRAKRKEKGIQETFKDNSYFIQLPEAGYPTVSPICGKHDGISNRVDRLEALGNSVNPQIVYNIMKAINIIDKNYKY